MRCCERVYSVVNGSMVMWMGPMVMRMGPRHQKFWDIFRWIPII